VHIYKAQAEDKNLVFSCQIASVLPQRVRADEKRLGQILMNVLGNAIKYTASGSIVFRISYSSGVANFQITDTGSGIDEQQLQNIFQPFTRLDSPSGNAIAGSGLGLTISKTLTEVMGGELAVQSQLGQGSTFTVRLLLPSLEATDNEHDAHAPVLGYKGQRRRILIVDDQREHRELLMALLDPLGFYLTEADSGENALIKAEAELPDLIVLDLSMSGINGIETALQLRQQQLTMPIIVISANAYPSDRLAALNAGCNDFLAKPIRVPELLAKLKLYLSLEWLYSDNTLPIEPPKASGFLRPPDALLQPCIDYIRIGDLLGLKKLLGELSHDHPDYAPFFSKLTQLAHQFRVGEIRTLVNLSGHQKTTL
jgi:CheY-like chemotaxis protein/anti-sigma regulatory factor (Ser/Thr protein kinase)